MNTPPDAQITHEPPTPRLKVALSTILGSNQLSPLPRPGAGTRAPSRAGGPSTFPFEKPIPVNTRDILTELRRYTDGAETGLARILFSTWNAERNAIKFQEIRNAIGSGDINPAWMERWTEDYSRYVNETLDPEWRNGIQNGGEAITRSMEQSLGFAVDFPETSARIEDWINARGASLTTGLATEQRKATRNILRRMIVDEAATPRDTAVVLRATIGLTPGDAEAVRKRMALLKSQGLTGKRLNDLTENYSGFLVRRRATRIARTETAFAFNFGAFEGMQLAEDEGLFGGATVLKRWSTADDERVCPFCGPLDGEVVGLKETFPGKTRQVPNTFTPPAHPNCRCSIEYEVVETPGNQVVKPEPSGPIAPTQLAPFKPKRFRGTPDEAIKKADDYFDDAFNSVGRSLSSDEVNAAVDYANYDIPVGINLDVIDTDPFEGIQRSLRDPRTGGPNRPPIEGLGTIEREAVRSLDRAIAKASVPDDIVTYRGVRIRDDGVDLGFAKTDFRKIVDNPEQLVGSTIELDGGFASTSYDRDLANEFGSGFGRDRVLFEIEVPAGTNALNIRTTAIENAQEFVDVDAFTRERELLLARETKARVISVEKTNPRSADKGVTIVKVRIEQ